MNVRTLLFNTSCLGYWFGTSCIKWVNSLRRKGVPVSSKGGRCWGLQRISYQGLKAEVRAASAASQWSVLVLWVPFTFCIAHVALSRDEAPLGLLKANQSASALKVCIGGVQSCIELNMATSNEAGEERQKLEVSPDVSKC